MPSNQDIIYLQDPFVGIFYRFRILFLKQFNRHVLLLMSTKTHEVFYPLESEQFKSSKPDTETVKKRIPKIRNRRVIEKPVIDILQLDLQIRERFEEEKKQLGGYKKRLDYMICALSKINIPFGVDSKIIDDINDIVDGYDIKNDTDVCLTFTYRDFLCFYEQFKRLIQKIENIESDILFQKYEELTGEIIKEYKQILSIPVKISFLHKIKPSNDVMSQRKAQLFNDFINVAAAFADLEQLGINILTQNDTQNNTDWKCSNCLSDEYEDTTYSRVCIGCGHDNPKMSEQTTFRDTERLNLHSQYRYEKKLHFKECVQQFQGKQNKKIEQWIYDDFDTWLSNHNLLCASSKKEEKYAKTTKEHLRLFMSESGDNRITKHYEDIHLMYFEITGRQCPDISHLEDLLYADFDKLVEAFLFLEDVERTNFLNGNFVLRKLLLVHNYQIKSEDFPGLKTISRREEHEDIWGKMIKKAGINDPGELLAAKRFV